MKYCENCKFYKEEFYDGDIFGVYSVSCVCKHPRCVQFIDNFSHREKLLLSISACRKDEELCGNEGKYFKWSWWKWLEEMFMKITGHV